MIQRQRAVCHDGSSTRVAICRLQYGYTYVAVELKLSNISHREVLLGPDLGSVEGIEIEIVGLAFGNGLDTKVPFWVLAALDCGPEILAVEVRILSRQLQGFIPHETMHTKMRCEMELDEVGFSLGVQQLVSVYTKSVTRVSLVFCKDSGNLPLHHLSSISMTSTKSWDSVCTYSV